MAGKLEGGEWIWKDGEFIPWADAQVHILSLAVQFGSSVFEGVRCYDTERGPAVFRLHDHIKRLMGSCRTYRMVPDYTEAQLVDASIETVRKNDISECYLRPMVLRGYGSMGMVGDASPIETYIPLWPWGTYLGPDALELGVDVCVTTWNRPAPNTHPIGAKSAGNYNNSQLMKLEAIARGYAEVIALGPSGLVSEGSGQNLFVIKDGLVITPIIDGTSLSGITRHAAMVIAEELGYTIKEQLVPREMLYSVDEMFFTGTATEITPIRSVDDIQVGEGRAGPVTKAIQERFLTLVRGKSPDPWGWVTYVD